MIPFQIQTYALLFREFDGQEDLLREASG